MIISPCFFHISSQIFCICRHLCLLWSVAVARALIREGKKGWQGDGAWRSNEAITRRLKDRTKFPSYEIQQLLVVQTVTVALILRLVLQYSMVHVAPILQVADQPGSLFCLRYSIAHYAVPQTYIFTCWFRPTFWSMSSQNCLNS